MFAKEGYGLIIASFGMFVVLGFLGWMTGGIPGYLIEGVGVFFLLFTLYFFRDPAREITKVDEWTMLSPADGKVVLIQEVDEPLYLDGRARQISVFLSPLNVHVNRAPIGGVVEFDEYVSGDYLVAWHEKASELNERSQIGVKHESGQKVLFKQIAGAVARRVVYHISVGDTVSTGDRFGIVKFGSRMDILFPVDADVSVEVGDKVRGGLTILGRLNQSSPRDSEQSL